MSSNTENIEAKLCAYVDGDLDEQGRLEIEKHLQANPQHRLLLEELRQTKIMMQALPREVAPPELAETLHSQLERSVLLDGVGTDEVSHSMKINRWPQLMAVAAVLLLACGLGILVYVILPKHADTTVAFTPAAEDKRSEKPSSEFGPVAAKGEREDLGGGKFADNPVIADLAKPAVVDLDDKERSKVGAKGKFSSKIDLTPKPAETMGEVAGLKQGEPAGPGPRRVYVVLSTDNLATTNEQVAKYLETNKIAWAPVPQQVALQQRLNGTTVQLRENGFNNATTNLANNTYNGVVATNNGGLNLNGGEANNFNNKPEAMSKTAVARGGDNSDNRSNNYKDNYKGEAQQQYRQYDASRRVQNNAETQVGQSQQVTAPQAPSQELMKQQQALTLNQQAGAQPTAQQPADEASFNLATNTKESMIVTRGITREQAVMLCDSLGKLYAGQTAVVVDRDLLEELPSTAPQVNKELADKLGTTTQPAAVAGEQKPATWSQSPVAGMDRVFQPTTPAPNAVDGAATTQPSSAPPPAPELAPSATRPADLAFAGGVGGGGGGQASFDQQKQLDLNVAPTTQPAQAPLEVVIVVQPATPAPPAAVTPEVTAAPAPATEPNAAAKPAAVPTTQPAADVAPNDATQNAK